MTLPRKIVFGGQTGADRAGLDWAISHGIEHGGWCPSGRTAEDGPLPGFYLLKETASPGYRQRTKANVADADGTLIINHGVLSGGLKLTQELAMQMKKPVLVVQLDQPLPAQAENAIEWFSEQGTCTLNIAGPSESRVSGIYSRALTFLEMLWHRNERSL